MRFRHPAALARTAVRSALAVVLTAGGVSAQTRIGTFAEGALPAATGGGNPGSDPRVAMGQVFRTPAAPGALTSLTYWFWTIPGLYDGGGSGLLSLYQFSGTAPAGAPVYEAPFTIPTNPVPLELTPVSWSPGVTLDPGALYIALLSGSNPVEATAVLNDVPDSGDNTTGGLALVCDALAGTCESAGEIVGVSVVHTFEASFAVSAVPEPRSLVLLAAGLLGIGTATARRRRG
jgi:hypothetical protein